MALRAVVSDGVWKVWSASKASKDQATVTPDASGQYAGPLRNGCAAAETAIILIASREHGGVREDELR